MKRNLSLPVKLLCAVLALAICLPLAACSGFGSSSGNSSTSDEAKTTEADYAEKLFDTGSVHEIDITITAEDLADLKANPTAKTKYKTDITIDGETVKDVSFATKGNTSLTAVAEDENSDRYSFKVNFGKYVDGQTYYGLNKLSLNNIYADATYMKDYLSYEIFRQAGVESPLVSYVWLKMNGEDHGLYLAIEDVSESYLDRTHNGEGELYKPETEQFENMAKGGGQPNDNNGDRQAPPNGAESPQNGQNNSELQSSSLPSQGENNTSGSQNNQPPQIPNGGMNGDIPEPPSGGMTPPNGFDPNNSANGEMPTMPEGAEMPSMPDGATPPDMPQGGGGFGSNASGADLKYTDDNADSYSDIFDNAETDADDESKLRVITALKALSQGNDIEKYIDTDEVIRYFAAHNFVLNYDSYTGNMLHNYYLYENNGKLSMLPWDYNLAFGAFGGEQGGKPGDTENGSSNATSLVNTGIDTPLSGSQESDRPMWGWIASDEKYIEQYHSVYSELLKYFESGDFDAEADRIYNMILPYVEKDTSAFYNAEQFKTAYETLKDFCSLRAESIRKQLDGTLSTKTTEQKDSEKIDASSVTISDMGTHGIGKDHKGSSAQNMTPPNMPNSSGTESKGNQQN